MRECFALLLRCSRRKRASALLPSSAGRDPVAEASHYGAGVVVAVFWVAFGVLASNVVPNVFVLLNGGGEAAKAASPVAQLSSGAYSTSTEGLITAAVSQLVPAVLLALHGRRLF